MRSDKQTAKASRTADESLRLESQPEGKLNLAGLIYLTADYAEARISDLDTRRSELYPIEEIKNLSPELDIHGFGYVSRLEKRKVEVVLPGRAQIRIRPAFVPEAEGSRLAEA